jgi:hypothetical protein
MSNSRQNWYFWTTFNRTSQCQIAWNSLCGSPVAVCKLTDSHVLQITGAFLSLLAKATKIRAAIMKISHMEMDVQLTPETSFILLRV